MHDNVEWRNKDGQAFPCIDWSAQGLSGWPVANFFSQPDLQRVLDEKARSVPTVEVFGGWEAQQFSHHYDRVELTVRKGHPDGGGTRVPEEETKTVRARYLIGADGANSFVHESMGAPVTDLEFDFDWLILDVVPHEEREWSPMNWQLCDPARPGPSSPTVPADGAGSSCCCPGSASRSSTPPRPPGACSIRGAGARRVGKMGIRSTVVIATFKERRNA